MPPHRREQAAHWFIVLRRGAMTLDERQAFDAWRMDPVNQRALDHMHELWGELSALDSLGLAIPRRRVGRRRPALAAALVASLAVTVALGGYAYLTGRDSQVKTDVGEQQTRTLPDGSVMAVNVVSDVDYRMRPAVRAIRLREGEAAFFVKKDPARPFLVEAGDWTIRALGTAFNVRRRDGVTKVAVSEGTVSVVYARGPRAGQELMRLPAGQQVALSALDSGVPARAVVVPVDSVAEWRMRVVDYEDVSVSDVVRDLNRFFERPLVVSDADLAERRVTIRLQVEDRDRTLHTLSDVLGVRVEPGATADSVTSREEAFF